MLSEVLMQVLESVVIVVITVVSTFLVKLITTKTEDISKKITSDDQEWCIKYIDIASECVSNAVSFVSQTYVDALKKDGLFTEECQREAYSLCVEKFKDTVPKVAVEIIAEMYGDINKWLELEIESEVKRQKESFGEVTILD